MPQIIPIKELKNTSEISKLCRNSTEPIFVTKNGYGEMVLMSMETYQNKISQINMYNELEISEKQIKENKVLDAKESIKALRKKYDL